MVAKGADPKPRPQHGGSVAFTGVGEGRRGVALVESISAAREEPTSNGGHIHPWFGQYAGGYAGLVDATTGAEVGAGAGAGVGAGVGAGQPLHSTGAGTEGDDGCGTEGEGPQCGRHGGEPERGGAWPGRARR